MRTKLRLTLGALAGWAVRFLFVSAQLRALRRRVIGVLRVQIDRALRLGEARAGRVGRGVAVEEPARIRTPPAARATRERAVDRRRGSAPAALAGLRASEMRILGERLVSSAVAMFLRFAACLVASRFTLRWWASPL